MGKIDEYYTLYYKGKEKKLSSEEKKRMNELAYQKAMEVRNHNPKKYGLILIGTTYEHVWKFYSNSKNVNCISLLFEIYYLKIRINEICFIYSLSKSDVIDYFERNNYVKSPLLDIAFS